jgi:hypothetical protein
MEACDAFPLAVIIETITRFRGIRIFIDCHTANRSVVAVAVCSAAFFSRNRHYYLYKRQGDHYPHEDMLSGREPLNAIHL